MEEEEAPLLDEEMNEVATVSSVTEKEGEMSEEDTEQKGGAETERAEETKRKMSLGPWESRVSQNLFSVPLRFTRKKETQQQV